MLEANIKLNMVDLKEACFEEIRQAEFNVLHAIEEFPPNSITNETLNKSFGTTYRKMNFYLCKRFIQRKFLLGCFMEKTMYKYV